jgi:hypothetical protein
MLLPRYWSRHRIGSDVERGEQARGAAPGVVVGTPLGRARHHRQYWLGAVQGRHAGLLIHTQHDGPLGRAVVKPNDVDNLVHELRVGGELEELQPVRFELEASPDPPDKSRVTNQSG